MNTKPVKTIEKHLDRESKYPWERVVKAYYNYYNTPETDPFFLSELKYRVKRNPVLKVSIADAIKKTVIKEEYTAPNIKDKGRLQLDVFSDCCKAMQHEMIMNGAHIPLPFGMGELLVSESFTQGVYKTKRAGIVKNKPRAIVKVKRYAVNSKGRSFKISWHKDKCRHSHARYYTFESCVGTIDVDFDTPVYYGNQGLAARIAELNNNPLVKDFIGSMYR
jgi:hypothetical protein